MSVIRIKSDGPVATIVLNRPEALNALSSGLCRELCKALSDLDADISTHVIILTGSGERAFSAGVDLKELGSNPDVLKLIAEFDPVKALEHCRKPIIGAINGVAITGGLELALGCDFLIASSTARFADTHARVGLLPGWGLSQRLSRTIGVYRARQFSLTGNFLGAESALAWGLVNEVIAPEALLARARTLADDIAGADPMLIGAYKALINRGFEAPFGSALEMERQVAWAYNHSVPNNSLDHRRAEVVERGRKQGDGTLSEQMPLNGK